MHLYKFYIIPLLNTKEFTSPPTKNYIPPCFSRPLACKYWTLPKLSYVAVVIIMDHIAFIIYHQQLHFHMKFVKWRLLIYENSGSDQGRSQTFQNWGGGKGCSDRDSKWRLSINPRTKCNFIWGAKGGLGFCLLRGAQAPLVDLRLAITGWSVYQTLFQKFSKRQCITNLECTFLRKNWFTGCNQVSEVHILYISKLSHWLY